MWKRGSPCHHCHKREFWCFLTPGEFYISLDLHVLQSERLPQRMPEQSRNYSGTRDAGREKRHTLLSLSFTCYIEFIPYVFKHKHTLFIRTWFTQNNQNKRLKAIKWSKRSSLFCDNDWLNVHYSAHFTTTI